MSGKIPLQQGERLASGEAVEEGYPTASVIIPHFNDLSNLDRCLALLEQQTYPEPFEVIVVDNASPIPLERVAAIVRNRALLLSCTEKGAGPARNTGIAAARAPKLAFIDSDCRPHPGWLAAGIAALQDADFVGGDVRVAVDDPACLTPVEAYEKVFAFRFKTYIEKKGFSGTGNLFVHRAVFDAVGGFKAQLSEDVEWSHRARAAGFRLRYAPDAIVDHPARRSWEEIKAKWLRMHLESQKLAWTKRNGALRYVARSWLVLASILPKGIEVARTGSLTGRRNRLGAFIVMAKIQCLRFGLAQLDFTRRLVRGSGP